MPSKGVVNPYLSRALMADLDFMGYKGIVLKSDQEPSILAVCDAVKNGWRGEIVLKPRPRARARELSVPVNLCTDLREPSKTSWSRNLELR